MIEIEKIMGRLGNKMFIFAMVYAKAKAENRDFYFQDYRYFDQYKKEIQDLYGEGIGYLPYVAIHVRRGDYINNPFYVELAKTGYYIDAINRFPDRKFLIFSDDIEFAKTYFEGDKFAFDDSENDIEAFNRMASCDSQIIANSSWSYWAAYLNKNPTKVIIAPTVDKWYSDGIERTICPKEWTRI